MRYALYRAALRVSAFLGTLSLALGCGGRPTPAPSTSDSVFLQSIPTSEYDQNILYYAGQAYPGSTLSETLSAKARAMDAFLAALPEDRLGTRYARGKWTVAEVVQHVISYEHIMAESALMIAGRAPRPLRYQRYTQASTAAGAEGKSVADLRRDAAAAHAYAVAAFTSLSEEELRRVGRHEGFRVSPRALGACLSGHQAHHLGVLRDRYLQSR